MILTATILLTFIVMEGIAWLMHKYIMHGAFWFLHADHHAHDHHDSIFEMNDTFFIFFSILAIASYLLWYQFQNAIFLGMGVGISIYGAVYFIIHDLFIHQRIKIWRKTNNPYLKAVRRAHKIHHKHLGKEDGECFGLLWVPLRYYKDVAKS